MVIKTTITLTAMRRKFLWEGIRARIFRIAS